MFAASEPLDIDTIEKRRWENVVLYGLTDLAEIAVLCTANYDVNVQAIIGGSRSVEATTNVPVLNSLPPEEEFDAVLITELNDTQKVYDQLIRSLPR